MKKPEWHNDVRSGFLFASQINNKFARHYAATSII